MSKRNFSNDNHKKANEAIYHDLDMIMQSYDEIVEIIHECLSHRAYRSAFSSA